MPISVSGKSWVLLKIDMEKCSLTGINPTSGTTIHGMSLKYFCKNWMQYVRDEMLHRKNIIMDKTTKKKWLLLSEQQDIPKCQTNDAGLYICLLMDPINRDQELPSTINPTNIDSLRRKFLWLLIKDNSNTIKVCQII